MSLIAVVIMHVSIEITFSTLSLLLLVFFVATATVTSNTRPSVVTSSCSATQPTASRSKKSKIFSIIFPLEENNFRKKDGTAITASV